MASEQLAPLPLAPVPLAPFRLAPWFSPRPWGTMDLSPWYDLQPREPIGEAWLTGHDCVVETGEHAGRRLGDVAAEYGEALLGDAALTDYPLLLKILFPHDKLSVQVHPDDAMAQSMGEPRGKTECWYVLESSPGASIDLGLKPGVDIAAVRAAIAGHTLEDLLEKVPVERGEMVFVDAGTVHAIGPGVTLLETQQNCDVTFRLYDYGRPRELHIERGLAATRLITRAGKVPVQPYRAGEHGAGERIGERLIAEQYFVVDRLRVSPEREFRSGAPTGTPHALVAIAGAAVLETEDLPPVSVPAGRAVIVPATVAHYRVRTDTACTLLRSMPPPR
ncbi:MAG: type I phosphomannose isomerase catalytic subunit [Acidobacteriaceae bacterium]